MDETSQPVELLLAVDREAPLTLGAQIEDGLRQAIRQGSMHPGGALPSTRDLARQLGVSRRVVVDAYAQLAAEGYLHLRQGARPRVSDAAAGSRRGAEREGTSGAAQRAPASGGATTTSGAAAAGWAGAAASRVAPRFDFRPSIPDVSHFPRRAWLRSLRTALTEIADADLGYANPVGVEALRVALADYLGRVRGVVAQPEQVIVTGGYSQGLGLICHALAARGAGRVALEDPSNLEQHEIVARAGLEPVPVEVDAEGINVAALARTGADAVVVTPAHQHPTGVVLAPERRAALLGWLRERDAFAIEDDYDAEYRFDRAAVGALQGLDPERVIYAGSVSKTLAPALRLGWLVVPAALLAAVAHQKQLADQGSNRIDQQAFADFMARGELDRHLRRMRSHYRARRDALVAALATALPEATVRGIAAGLHATVELPSGHDEQAIQAAAAERRIACATLADYTNRPHPPTLVLGYAQPTEPAIARGVKELAELVHRAPRLAEARA